MITVTIGDILRHDMPDAYFQARHCIYVVKRDGQSLYVGQASHQSTQERLLQHLAATLDSGYRGAANGPSDLGEFVLANMPLSHDWHVDLLTLADCQRLANLPHHQLTIGEAERLLIKRYAPLLNQANNARPSAAMSQRKGAPPTKRVLPEFADDYLAAVSANRKTQDTYSYALQRFQRYAEAEGLTSASMPAQPGRLQREVLVDFVKWLGDAGAKNNTIRTFVAVVRQYLTWLQGQDQGLGAQRLAEIELALEKATGPHMHSIPHEHRQADYTVARLFAYFVDQSNGSFPKTSRGQQQNLAALRNHAIAQTLYSTAGRASEVATLSRKSIEDIPLESGTTTGGSERRPVAVEIVGKGGRSRPIFLTPEALNAIRAYLAARDTSAAKVVSARRSSQSDAVFVRHDRSSEKAITTKTVWQIISQASGEVFGLDAAGKPSKRFGPRDFRHLRAQDLFDDGMPIDTLQAILGHSSLATTLRTYGGHPMQERLSRELEQFGRDPGEAANR